MNYELHPLCTLFPRMSGGDFQALRDDIAVNGLREPIILFEGMILDGGNRYEACKAAGVKPSFFTFQGNDIGSLVLSANLHRRHLTAGQHAAIVASVQNWATAQRVGKPKSGNVTGLQTVAERRVFSGASEKTQRDADKVARSSPELAKQVGRGEITLPDAKRIVEGKPKPEKRIPDPPPVDERAEQIEELLYQNRKLEAENAKFTALTAGEAAIDKLISDLNVQIEQLTQDLAHAVRRRDEEMNKASQAIKDLKFWQRKADRLEAKKAA